MTIQQLHYAIVIAEAGSLNKAAERLYVSQPSLTNAMQELEKELNITIFHRSGRGVTLTPEGADFMLYARQVVHQYEDLLDRYGKGQGMKKKFGVSTQHYSFAVKAFVELVKQYDTTQYEFAIRETKTRDVIQDVAHMRSEIGLLYLSDFNRAAITKLLRSADLAFHPLIDCRAYVYMWAGHPLAREQSLTLAQLQDYPCLSFEQGDDSSFYFAEEILTTREYLRTIKANDRATMLNLMIGLNGYTLCSGIICEELNGSDYVAVPFCADNAEDNRVMEIGYITKKNTILSQTGEQYIEEVRRYLTAAQAGGPNGRCEKSRSKSVSACSCFWGYAPATQAARRESVAPLARSPSRTMASGSAALIAATEVPMPLLPEVQNGITTLPDRS